MSWNRIRGHDPIVQQFRTAFERGRLGHAYLLVGPAGVGKRLFASELAKALLCENPPAPLTACDHCAGCALVAAGTHPDFMTVRKPEDKIEFPIDTMRQFVKDLGLKPSRGSRKIAMVEDAETFNEESANAFLKSLEEPPPGSLLLLRATSLETQLATIQSRCQPVTFNPLNAKVVKEVLQSMPEIKPDRMERLAAMCHGCIGQAVALNDDALWEFRGTLIETLAAPRFQSALLAETWAKFIEEAGKESSKQRARTSLALQLLIDLLRRVAAMSLGSSPVDDEDRRLAPMANRLGTERVMTVMEACLDADRHVDQRVNLPMTIEYLVDRIAVAA